MLAVGIVYIKKYSKPRTQYLLFRLLLVCCLVDYLGRGRSRRIGALSICKNICVCVHICICIFAYAIHNCKEGRCLCVFASGSARLCVCIVQQILYCDRHRVALVLCLLVVRTHLVVVGLLYTGLLHSQKFKARTFNWHLLKKMLLLQKQSLNCFCRCLVPFIFFLCLQQLPFANTGQHWPRSW